MIYVKREKKPFLIKKRTKPPLALSACLCLSLRVEVRIKRIKCQAHEKAPLFARDFECGLRRKFPRHPSLDGTAAVSVGFDDEVDGKPEPFEHPQGLVEAGRAHIFVEEVVQIGFRQACWP